jgi:AbrB family looped-hinge helix DNA binding protein
MSRLSRKNQVTLPVEVLRRAGIAAGDELVVRVTGPGRLELERAPDLVARWAGALQPGTYPEGHVSALRDEWQR